MNLLFPGRHHILTKFQQDFLLNVVQNGVSGKKIDRIIFAVTSANHENTRRNPIPLYLRCLAINEFAASLPCEVKIYPIPDIEYSDKFAQFMLRQIMYQGGETLTPQNTILACSTPPVISLFAKMKFKNLSVELVGKDKYSSLRPYEVIDLLVKAGKKWRQDNEWKKYAAIASQNIYLEYNIGDLLVELFADALLSPDAEITTTRDYNTYAFAMDNIIKIKFDDIKPYVVEGKIVDVGCSTGSLIRLLAREFQESDIIGIEATRKFYEFCRSQEYETPFVFFYRRNITDQNFKDNTVNTFIYSSVLHEVYSYINEKTLKQVLVNTYKQLKHGGRIIIRDVVGPANPKQKVLMKLRKTDGAFKGSVERLCTYARFFRFAQDFLPRKINYRLKNIDGIDYVDLTIQDAYEFMSKMTYTDNWKSEMHEEFGFYSYQGWCQLLKKIGFKIVPGSREFKNPHIVEHVYAPRAELFVSQNGKLKKIDYPATNMVLVGQK